VRLWILVAFLLAACTSGGAEPTSTPTPAAPDDVASEWLAAVGEGDVAALRTLVEPQGLAVLAGVENSLRSDEMVGLLRSGFSDDLAVDYWSSFRDDFALIRGIPITALSVGAVQIDDPVPGMATVEVDSGESSATVGLRRTSSGVWQVDMVATVGSALVGPLSEYLSSALTGGNADEIAGAYRSGVLPGLELAAALNPQSSDLVFELEYIRQLVG
jgi:hypothetical protein